MRIWFALSLVVFGSRYAGDVRDFFFPQPEAQAEPSAQPEARPPNRLRLASWNLQFLDVMGHGQRARGKADLQALARYAKRVDADIVAVQEVASTEALAAVFPPEQYAYYLAHKGGPQHVGFAYRKRLPVRIHPDVDALAVGGLRAGADLSVQLGAQTLRILSIHLKAFCVVGALDQRNKHCEKLAAQVPALEAWIDARARDGDPYVVVGDFNRVLGDGKDALYRELDDGEPASLQLQRASPRVRTRCLGGRTQSAIDHIVLGGAAGDWLQPGGFIEFSYDPGDLQGNYQLSDHCPIAVDLELPSHVRR